MSELPLAGKVAWITGSSRGLGRVMAEELCEMGACVAVHGTRENSPETFGEGQTMSQLAEDIASQYEGECIGVWGDILRKKTFSEWPQRSEGTGGRLIFW